MCVCVCACLCAKQLHEELHNQLAKLVNTQFIKMNVRQVHFAAYTAQKKVLQSAQKAARQLITVEWECVI